MNVPHPHNGKTTKPNSGRVISLAMEMEETPTLEANTKTPKMTHFAMFFVQ